MSADATRERFTLSAPRPAVRTEILVGRGLLDGLAARVEEHASAPAYAVVSDATVAELYGGGVAEALEMAGRRAQLFSFPAGETSKTTERWDSLLESFAEMGLGRDGCVVAVGGGVTGDLAGFAAAAYARGVALVHVPTSLLAMIDAAIGGKTGVDLRAGKNLAGAFHHPRLVAVDPATLDTLPDDQFRGGLAEAVKHGAIADADHFRFLQGRAASILERSPGDLDRLITDSIRVKVGVVQRDAAEAGERAVLNLGHTIAHGIERVTGYAVPHGEAVAMGLVAEARIGERVGVTEPGTAARIRDVLEALRLPTRVPEHVETPALLEAARADKKARDGRIRYTLIAGIGRAARTRDGEWTHAVPETEVAAALGPDHAASHPV